MMNALRFGSTLSIFLLFVIIPDLSQSQTRILVVYYSETGNTQAMAEAVAAGAKTVPGVEVRLTSVQEAMPADLLTADAVIVGSPVYNAAVAPRIQEFINSWPFDGSMRDKIGAAFVTGGGISAGEELVQTGILHSMMIFGMIVVGGSDWYSPFGASGVTVEAPFESDQTGPDARFLRKAEALGKRVAELAKRMK